MQVVSEQSQSSSLPLSSHQEHTTQRQATLSELLEPTYQEAEHALKTLQREYPWLDLKQVVQLLYQKITIDRDPKFAKMLDNRPLEQQFQFSPLLSSAFLASEGTWEPEVTEVLINCYIGNPCVQHTSKVLAQKYPNQPFSTPECVHQQLRRVLQLALQRLKAQQELPQCVSQGHRFKRLVKLDSATTEMILELEEATEVRVMLCQFFLLKCVDLNALVYTILLVNQFVNRKENQAIQVSLQRAKANNSINRQEYAFEGKRRKVLVLKRPSKPRKSQL